MLTDVSAIRTYFSKLGLESEIADIYLSLHANGPQTISALARSSGVERTRIYRLIDSLLASSLIEVEAQHKRGVIRAAPIANLHILISQKEQELRSLQDELSLIEQTLARNSLSSPTTRVQFYTGPEGYKQMMWNESKAEKEIMGIIYNIEPPKTGVTFFNRWVEECNKNGIHYREIHGDTFRTSVNKWYPEHQNAKLASYEPRYVDKKTFDITHTMTMYNDVVAYLNWHDKEIFGIEIYNQQIADNQRSFFEMLWQKATPETGRFGTTSSK